MNCRKCGAAVPPESKFCPECGTSTSRSRAEFPSASAKPQKKKFAILGALAGLLVIACLVLLLLATPKSQTPVTTAPNAPRPPAMTPKQKQGPPADIVAYLDHVKRIEATRQNMRVDLTPAFDMLRKAQGLQTDTEEDSRAQKQQDISSGVDQYTAKWQQLVNEFNSVRAPSGCEQLAGAYATALGKYSQVMINIQVALSKQDLGALMQMQGSAQADVDASLVQADQQLSAVCQTYDIQKSFSISPDKGVDSLLSPTR